MLRGGRRRAVDAQARRASSTRATTRRRATPRRTPASGCSSSASRTRASSSPPGCRRGRRRITCRVAVAGQDLGADAVAGRRPGALRAAVRGQLPRASASSILDASIDAIDHDGERAAGSSSSAPTTAMPMTSRPTRSSRRPASPARCATCRRSGWRRSGRRKLPAVTPFWESATRARASTSPGTDQPGARAGLKKHGIPSNSGAVHGHRYNARVLARHIAERHFGDVDRRGRWSRQADVVPYLLREATRAPELWHQKAYLARVVSVVAGRRDPRRGHPAAGPCPRRHGPRT